MRDLAGLLDKGAWTLTENARIVADAKRLEAQTRALAIRHSPHQLRVIAGGSGSRNDGVRLRVLIVDDDRRVVELLGDSFKDSYTVDIALNAGEALTIVRRERPDVVVLDIVLPGVSGLHLLREIKRVDATIAVIMVTGSGDVALAAEAIDAGAAGVVRKPFDMRYLNRLVAEIVASSGPR